MGLDNIGVFDRSSPLPTGGYIGMPFPYLHVNKVTRLIISLQTEQADGTAWMAFYSLMMLNIAMELAAIVRMCSVSRSREIN